MNGDPLERLVQACGGLHARRCEEEEDRLAEKICQRAIQKALNEANNEIENNNNNSVRFESCMKKSHSVPTRSDEWEAVPQDDDEEYEEEYENEEQEENMVYDKSETPALVCPEIAVQSEDQANNVPQIGFGSDTDNLGCPVIAIQGPTPIASRCVSPRKEELEPDELISSDEIEVEAKSEDGASTPTSGHSTPDEDVMSPFSFWLDECSQNLTHQIITESLAEECQVLVEDLQIINKSVQLVDSNLAALQQEMANMMQNDELMQMQDRINKKYHQSNNKSFEELEFEKSKQSNFDDDNDFASNSSGNDDATPINEYGMKISELTPIHQMNFDSNPFGENSNKINDGSSLHSSENEETHLDNDLPSAADLHRDVSQYCYWKTEPVVWTNYSLSGASKHDPSVVVETQHDLETRNESEINNNNPEIENNVSFADNPYTSSSSINQEQKTTNNPKTPTTPTHYCRISKVSCSDFEIDEIARMLCKTAMRQAMQELENEESWLILKEPDIEVNNVDIRTGETDLDLFQSSQNGTNLDGLQVEKEQRSRHTSILTNSSSQNSFTYDLIEGPQIAVSHGGGGGGLRPDGLVADNQALISSEEPFNRPISPMPPR